jgi:hypothetical protein
MLIGGHSFASAICENFIRQQERFFNIPTDLLKSISLVESGRALPNGRLAPWPWTINVNGKGFMFKTKEEAIAAVKKYQHQGITSIDVGPMQVNLKHHPNAFRHLSDALDPQINIAYAAQYLSDLKHQLGSWKSAVAHYHSASPTYHMPYREKIHCQWSKLRQKNGITAPISSDVVYNTRSPAADIQMISSKPKPKDKGILTQKGIAIMPPGRFFSARGATTSRTVSASSPQHTRATIIPAKPETPDFVHVTYRRFLPVK